MRTDTEIEGEALVDGNERMKYIRTAKTRVIESEFSASLPLQILIFYHSYYAPVMFILILFTNTYKQLYFDDIYQPLHLLAVVLWGIVEYFRLYFGFSGNIKESFPELTAFMIISIVFSLPLLIYQMYFISIKFPIDKSTFIVELVFLLIEIFFAFGTVSKLVKNQTARFFLRNSHPDLYYRVIPT